MVIKEEEQKKLCLRLLKSETETDVKRILKEMGLWDNEDLWITYGDDEYNFRTIGNQQSDSDTALVEKIINSIDAVILREAKVRGIKPDDPKAPKSIHKALELFFNISEGKIGNLTRAEKKIKSENIVLVASGRKTSHSITIIDKGEGQTPDQFKHTFLSLSGSNKVFTPYVQGKFNMGSTGVLEFCGNENLQLIVSKKFEGLIKGFDDDKKWGFTIVRRFEPKGQMKFSVTRY